MNQIAFFLERFKNIESPEALIKKTVADSVKKVSGVDVDLKNIKISKRNVFIEVSPALKSEIMINHEEISKDINSNLGIR